MFINVRENTCSKIRCYFSQSRIAKQSIDKFNSKSFIQKFCSFYFIGFLYEFEFLKNLSHVGGCFKATMDKNLLGFDDINMCSYTLPFEFCLIVPSNANFGTTHTGHQILQHCDSDGKCLLAGRRSCEAEDFGSLRLWYS